MAFFRNFGNEMESGNDLNEKGGDIEAEEDYISAGNNRQMDLNFAENDAEMKLDNHYQSEGVAMDAGRQQSDGSGGNAQSGKGSNFWKDCQPVWGRNDEEVDSKKNEEVIAVNSDEDSDGQKDGMQFQRGLVDVPADEMLSDDYYEQDGEEQSDSLLGRGRSITSISGSRLPPRPVPVTENAAKSSKATKYDEYDDFEDYEESDEEEEDDPDDVGFEPDFGDTCKSIKNKEFANVNGKLTKGKGSRKNAKVEAENLIISNSRSKYGNLKSGFPKLNSRTKEESLQKHQRVEPRVKEGEISESEPENFEQYKEEKWMEWCADVMEEEEQTLTRLERLQSTSLDLS